MVPEVASVREGENTQFMCMSDLLVVWYLKGSEKSIAYGNTLEITNVSKFNAEYECRGRDSREMAFRAVGVLQVTGMAAISVEIS